MNPAESKFTMQKMKFSEIQLIAEFQKIYCYIHLLYVDLLYSKVYNINKMEECLWILLRYLAQI